MSEITNAPRKNRVSDALADLKKENNKLGSSQHSSQSNQSNDESDNGCLTWLVFFVAMIVGFLIFSMM